HAAARRPQGLGGGELPPGGDQEIGCRARPAGAAPLRDAGDLGPEPAAPPNRGPAPPPTPSPIGGRPRAAPHRRPGPSVVVGRARASRTNGGTHRRAGRPGPSEGSIDRPHLGHAWNAAPRVG